MFLYGSGTEAYRSCSVTCRGEFYISGGRYEKKQISKLNKCKLERVASLPYVFDSVVKQKPKTVGPMIFQEILVTNESLGSTEFKSRKKSVR